LCRAIAARLRHPFNSHADFTNPEVKEFLEDEAIEYAIPLLADGIPQERIGHLFGWLGEWKRYCFQGDAYWIAAYHRSAEAVDGGAGELPGPTRWQYRNGPVDGHASSNIYSKRKDSKQFNCVSAVPIYARIGNT
jgi:hypothetical protein